MGSYCLEVNIEARPAGKKARDGGEAGVRLGGRREAEDERWGNQECSQLENRLQLNGNGVKTAV